MSIINYGVSKYYSAGSQVSDRCPLGYLFHISSCVLWLSLCLFHKSTTCPAYFVCFIFCSVYYSYHYCFVYFGCSSICSLFVPYCVATFCLLHLSPFCSAYFDCHSAFSIFSSCAAYFGCWYIFSVCSAHCSAKLVWPVRC